MKKSLKIAAAATLGLGAVLLLLFAFLPPKTPQKVSSPQNPLYSVPLVIDFGNGERLSFQVPAAPGASAFDILKEAAKLHNLKLAYKNSNLGVFVESIGSRENGKGGRYWLYYINGLAPQTAVDKRIIKKGERLEFRFEKPSF
jgi:hypothetical protein